MGELAVMNGSGDTKVFWSAENADEVESARRTFRDLRAKGHVAYKLLGDGSKGEQINEFDEDAEKIILAPQMKGG
jgi:hypothetical protein